MRCAGRPRWSERNNNDDVESRISVESRSTDPNKDDDEHHQNNNKNSRLDCFGAMRKTQQCLDATKKKALLLGNNNCGQRDKIAAKKKKKKKKKLAPLDVLGTIQEGDEDEDSIFLEDCISVLSTSTTDSSEGFSAESSRTLRHEDDDDDDDGGVVKEGDQANTPTKNCDDDEGSCNSDDAQCGVDPQSKNVGKEERRRPQEEEEIDCCRCSDCGRQESFSHLRNCGNRDCDVWLCRTCQRRWGSSSTAAKAVHHCSCRECYLRASEVERRSFHQHRHHEVVEPDARHRSDVTLVLTRSAGDTSSRVAFRRHAGYFSDHYGHRCILLDLPTTSTTTTVVEERARVIREILDHYGVPPAAEAEASGRKTVFVSCGGGGDISLWRVLSSVGDYFSGVVLDSCCGDGVGSRRCSVSKNVRLTDVLPCASLTGTTTSTSSREQRLSDVVPRLACPVLFLQGTMDVRGYDPKTLRRVMDLLRAREESKVVLFEGGDHTVSDDVRFFHDWVEKAASFVHYASVLS